MDIEKSALLFLDFQVDVCEAGGKMVSQDSGVLESFKRARQNAASLLTDVRKAKRSPLLFHIMHVFNEGYPELEGGQLSGMESYVKKTGAFIDGNKGTEIVKELFPMEGEHVIKKHTLSPFASTDLGMRLRKHDISTVILGGVVTHYAILSTAFSAYDLGYSVIVLKDCCMSGTDETHNVSLEILGPISTLMSGSDISDLLS